MPAMKMDIKPISASQTYDIRHRVLRPKQDISECQYPRDEQRSTFHLGGYWNGELVGIASFYEEPPSHFRLRGMAVIPEWQGMGFGKQLLHRAMERLSGAGVVSLWCNARTSAANFYFDLGFEKAGDEFEIEGIGPHYVLRYKMPR